MGKLFLLFTVTPLVELYLLIRIGTWIGALPTVLLVVVTGFAGAYLAKLQGFQVWMRIQYEVNAGRFPATSLLDGLLLFAAGLVLITPGIITDVLGFLLIIPLTRAPIRDWLARKLRRMMDRGTVEIRGFMQ
ncbi:MAG: FxsA family protein [Spirochaetaceae bacterium]|nr:MAG: FxsA family protein [Spirochaetaceae bacterium]